MLEAAARTEERDALLAGGTDRGDAAGGWFSFLVAPRDPLIIVVRIVPPFDTL
ncbi:hypothetical protein AB0L85_10060 [Streptomyces sp. NPDC052051]|uniref:hypothetical protein n=1 Tax=Streptomyces sp. NPDC052051 TaxID=3154649 RepID=UPI003437BD81